MALPAITTGLTTEHDAGTTGARPGTSSARVTVPGTAAVATVHRTPVMDLDGRVLGYTITVDPERPPGVDVDAVYLGLDLTGLVADRYAFVPATPAMLDGYVPTPPVAGRLVLSLPFGFAATDGAAGRAAALRGLGMSLALEGFRGDLAQRALLPFCSFVVVDAGPSGPLVAPLVHQAHAQGVRVLAANVATDAELDACRAAGVDGLAGGPIGDLGAAPSFVPTQRGPRDVPAPGRPAAGGAAGSGTASGARVLRAGEAQCLAILNLLGQPESSPADVAQVMETDPVLTLRVLHLVNSGAYALSHQVDTVRQAVVLLGPTEVSTLVTALALDARPGAMDRLWFILARAMTCETLADDPAAYTVGMLSALAAQLGLPVDVLLEKVGVSDVVGEAIAYEEGPLGPVLRAVRCHEQSDVEGVIAAGLDPVAVSRAYLACLRGALGIARTVTREP